MALSEVENLVFDECRKGILSDAEIREKYNIHHKTLDKLRRMVAGETAQAKADLAAGKVEPGGPIPAHVLREVKEPTPGPKIAVGRTLEPHGNAFFSLRGPEQIHGEEVVYKTCLLKTDRLDHNLDHAWKPFTGKRVVVNGRQVMTYDPEGDVIVSRSGKWGKFWRTKAEAKAIRDQQNAKHNQVMEKLKRGKGAAEAPNLPHGMTQELESRELVAPAGTKPVG